MKNIPCYVANICYIEHFFSQKITKNLKQRIASELGVKRRSHLLQPVSQSASDLVERKPWTMSAPIQANLTKNLL